MVGLYEFTLDVERRGYRGLAGAFRSLVSAVAGLNTDTRWVFPGETDYANPQSYF